MSLSGVKRTWPIAVQMSACDPKQTFQIIGRRHHVELDKHSKLIAADPFFSDFSVACTVILYATTVPKDAL
jgi:hypothetical protein